MDGDSIRYHRNINMGIAVALDWGLIVPVIKNAEEKNVVGLQRAITDLGDRARTKKLKPEDVQGGTFTITNPGQFGQMFGLPIINQPQVAIMGIGSIKKMPVVLTDENGTDSIAIRQICHVSLGYDHRIIDGAVADQFSAPSRNSSKAGTKNCCNDRFTRERERTERERKINGCRPLDCTFLSNGTGCRSPSPAFFTSP